MESEYCYSLIITLTRKLKIVTLFLDVGQKRPNDENEAMMTTTEKERRSYGVQ